VRQNGRWYSLSNHPSATRAKKKAGTNLDV